MTPVCQQIVDCLDQINASVRFLSLHPPTVNRLLGGGASFGLLLHHFQGVQQAHVVNFTKMKVIHPYHHCASMLWN